MNNDAEYAGTWAYRALAQLQDAQRDLAEVWLRGRDHTTGNIGWEVVRALRSARGAVAEMEKIQAITERPAAEIASAPPKSEPDLEVALICAAIAQADERGVDRETVLEALGLLGVSLSTERVKVIRQCRPTPLADLIRQNQEDLLEAIEAARGCPPDEAPSRGPASSVSAGEQAPTRPKPAHPIAQLLHRALELLDPDPTRPADGAR
ncbi:MAG: hypothetical protein RIB45_17685 [Marivibrio sp.]|uniref:hypothetical protein n=1 Tax=Marivibrio sp. TaxID=2039719 RepID=UPI0032EBC53B